MHIYDKVTKHSLIYFLNLPSISKDALSGDPQSKGGFGSYSIAS